MRGYIKQLFKDQFIDSSILIVIVACAFIGYFSYKMGILDEPTSLAFFALFALVGIAGYFVFIHKYRKKTREIGIMLLRELKDIIAGDDIENRRFSDFFSVQGRYKNRPISCTFQNTTSNVSLGATTAEIYIKLTIGKIPPPKSIMAKLFWVKLTRISDNIILSHDVLLYGPITLKAFRNIENKRQELINILDELVRAADQVESSGQFR